MWYFYFAVTLAGIVQHMKPVSEWICSSVTFPRGAICWYAICVTVLLTCFPNILYISRVFLQLRMVLCYYSCVLWIPAFLVKSHFKWYFMCLLFSFLISWVGLGISLDSVSIIGVSLYLHLYRLDEQVKLRQASATTHSRQRLCCSSKRYKVVTKIN